MDPKRGDSDTISNIFMSTVKSCNSTFLLDTRELTVEDVHCLRTSTTGSTDSGVHSFGLLALDTDGAGEDEWLVCTPPESKQRPRPAPQPMVPIPEAIYCSAPQIGSMHEGPPKAAHRKRSASDPEQATVYAVRAKAASTAGYLFESGPAAGSSVVPSSTLPGSQDAREASESSWVPAPMSPPRTRPSVKRSQTPSQLPASPGSPRLSGKGSTELRTSAASASRIPNAASVRGSSAASRSSSAGSLSPDGSVPPSRLRRPGVSKPRKPDLKDLEDGWRGCIEEPSEPTEGQAGASSQGADGEGENAGKCQPVKNSLSQEARLQGPLGDMTSTPESKKMKDPAKSGDSETAADGQPEQQQQPQHKVAPKRTCCALM